MKCTLKNKLVALGIAAVLAVGGASTAYATSFGNRLNGASSTEVLQIRYDGAAWNYRGSGYRNAWFRYSRNGRTLLYREVRNGRVTGTVWDNLIDWSPSQTTRFTWGHQK